MCLVLLSDTDSVSTLQEDKSMYKDKSISVVVPAYNEETQI